MFTHTIMFGLDLSLLGVVTDGCAVVATLQDDRTGVVNERHDSITWVLVKVYNSTRKNVLQPELPEFSSQLRRK
jgi:hypothetical protein